MNTTRRYRPSPAVAETLRQVVQADPLGGLCVRDWQAPDAPNQDHLRGLCRRGWVQVLSPGRSYRPTPDGKTGPSCAR